MAEVNFRSAVLLLHDENGAKAIANSSGGLTAVVVHDLDYQGRQNEYEQRGGCERELTQTDMEMVAKQELGEDIERMLDYNARLGEFSEKGRERMEDATYWGQHGPLTRKEIEQDMLACGGAALSSLVTVDRKYAAELGITTKADFERLLRANWQNMMMEAGIAKNPADIHWYANYHTDAAHSLHVHITTWVAKTPLTPGWTVTAGATRQMKGMLYRDAYAVPRLERDIEQNYLRSLLPVIAKRELGMRVSERSLEYVERNAKEFGVEKPVIERTIDEKAQQCLEKKLNVLLERLQEGDTGNLWRNYRAYSAAKSVVDELRKQSEPFKEAYDRYKAYLEEKADMKGLALPKERDREILQEHIRDNAKLERSLQAMHITEVERRKFIDNGIKDIRNRIAYPLMREVLPEARREDVIREVNRDIRPELIKHALDPKRNVLQLSPDNQAMIKNLVQDAASHRLDNKDLTEARIQQAAEQIVQSKGCQEQIRDAIPRLKDLSPDFEDKTDEYTKQEIENVLAKDISHEFSWRLEKGMVAPFGIEAWDLSKDMIRKNTRGFMRELVLTQGVSLGFNKHEYEQFKKEYDKTVGMAMRAKTPIAKEHVATRCKDLSARLVAAPVMQNLVDRTHHHALLQFGEESAPAREKIEGMLEVKVTSVVEHSVDNHVQHGTTLEHSPKQDEELSIGIGLTDLGLGYLAAQMARELIQERDRNIGGASRWDREQKQARKR